MSDESIITINPEPDIPDERPQRVVATVVSYWPNRVGNVAAIVEALQAGSVVPDRIIVVNNGTSDLDHLASDIVAVMRVGLNSWTRGKFVAALFEPAHYYLMMDDDTSVGLDTLKALLKAAARRRGFVTGYWGVKLTEGRSFMNGAIITPESIPEPMKVDAFHGRAVFASYDAVVRMVASEEYVRFDEGNEMRWPHEGDDILIGLANQVTPGCWMLPLRGDARFVDLDQCGQALQFEDAYFGERDAFTLDAVAALNAHPSPIWS